MTFYSQTGEDDFLNLNYFKNKKDGVYIELGALDGVKYSNTKFFEDNLNWKGVLIEPNPDEFEMLKINRKNNFLFNNLISCCKEPQSFRYFLNHDLAAVSGIENTLSQHHFDTFYNNISFNSSEQKIIEIIPKTLTEVINATNIKHIDFMSLDVEGHELEVLQSWDFRVPIDLILIETLGVQPLKDESCRKILLENGYKFETKFQHNEIFILDNIF